MSTIIGNPIMLGGGSSISAPIIGKDFNWTGSDLTYRVIEDGEGNWRIKFLSSGTFTPLEDMLVDAFLVGGGAGGENGALGNAAPGGGSGYTTTVNSVQLTANTEYSIVVGAGGTASNNGGKSTACEASANGGRAGSGSASSAKGGNGGSGGGVGTGEGGIDGANAAGNGGTGQGTTTREFGESTGDLYATGGGGSGSSTAEQSGAPNTGDGGSGSMTVKAGAGGSGIVIIRKHKEAAA